MSTNEGGIPPAQHALFDVLRYAAGINDPDALGQCAVAFELGARLMTVAEGHTRRWLAMRDAERRPREMPSDEELRAIAQGIVALATERAKA